MIDTGRYLPGGALIRLLLSSAYLHKPPKGKIAATV